MAYLEYPRKYPQVNLFVAMQLPILPVHKPSVFEQFRIYSELPEPDAKGIVQQRYDPKIRVKDTGPLYGFTPATGQEVWIHDGIVNDIESLLSGQSEILSGSAYFETQQERRAVFSRILPKLHLLLEVTILHELVHYGRRLVNGYNPNQDFEEMIADQFEKHAYGEELTATSLRINDILPEPGSTARKQRAQQRTSK